MSRYTGVTWDPSLNLRAGPTAKRRVVLHRMAGPYAGGLSWLKNPASQVSAHFVVDNVSGEGRQLVDTADVAWAEAAYNRDSISIEIGGEPADPVSAAAWSMIVHLIAQTVHHDGVPLRPAAAPDFVGIAYHGQLGALGGNHPDCPGAVVISKIPALLSTFANFEEAPMATATMTPTGRGTWRVHPDGAVYTAGDAEYFGGYPDLPPAEREAPAAFVAIERLGPTMDDGYVIINADGGAYRFDAAVWATLRPKS